MGDLSQACIGVIGAGTMGSGIAQVAALHGHSVVIYDIEPERLLRSKASIDKALQRLSEKGKITAADVGDILEKIKFVDELSSFSDCALIIEAILEDLDEKQETFASLETIVKQECILGTNTSSLSVTAIASGCARPERVVGLHFFNPAPLMPLVEIVPGLCTLQSVIADGQRLVNSWEKVSVTAKDTPGFIVNRVARPFYGEALRILEEQMADVATIDWALREVGGFRMGPFELMDLIGNDINFAVTQSIFEAFFYDPRYKPSFTQKRLVEAKYLGRKTGRGYYDYTPGAPAPAPLTDKKLGEEIVSRILSMLINEAAEAVFLGVASDHDIDLAVTKGVNYPKGLLAWADELGISTVLKRLEALQSEFGEDRYRPSALLRRMARDGRRFFA